MKDVIQIRWDFLGAKLATLSDEEQALFFKGFANELNSFESHYAKEMQMTYVNSKLDNKTKDVLERYMPAIWYKDEN